MKKSDLKTGMRIVTRDDSIMLVLLNTEHGDIVCTANMGWDYIKNYRDDLTSCGNLNENLDIVEIYDAKEGHEYQKNLEETKEIFSLIWERKEEKLIVIAGKEYSEHTVKKALQEYCK